MKHSPRGIGTAAEASAFLEANPDIEAVQLVITDACGVGRGKNVAREELAALYGSGRNVAGSILGLDVTGEDVDGDRAGLGRGRCRPVLSSRGGLALPGAVAGAADRPGARHDVSNWTVGRPRPIRGTCWPRQSRAARPPATRR